MKILITNIVTLNVGDAAILYATADLLRSAFDGEAEFVVYDKQGDVTARYHPEFNFRKFIYLTRGSKLIQSIDAKTSRLLPPLDEIRFNAGLWAVKNGVPILPRILLTDVELRDLLDYKTADLIVSGGGTYLVENYSFDARLFDYRITRYFGRPLVFFTQSLGPFRNAALRRSLKEIFDASVAILVRDKESLGNLKDLGVANSRIYVSADAAFALSDPAAVELAKTKSLNRSQPLRVAISVREWRHFKQIDPELGMAQYQDAVLALTRHLVEKHDADITYLSTCQGMAEYWTDDSKTAQLIVDRLDDRARTHVLVNADFHSPSVMADFLKSYDVVIATRMHVAILALGMGTPVLPIAYEFKMQELFLRLGVLRWVQDIETISSQTLIKSFELLLGELPEIREALFTAVQREREVALASGEVVRRAFEEWRQINSGR